MTDGGANQLLRDIEYLVREKHIRSADRANMKRLLAKARREGLTRTEREHLWSYIERYRSDAGRP